MEIVDKHWKKNKDKIDNWVPKKEDQIVLIKLIEKFKLKSFFEIGAYSGFTTELLSSHPNIKRWKAIDINPRVAHPNILKYDSLKYEPSKEFNGEIEHYDLVFIDGDHLRVKEDTELALKMKPKVITWHDYNSQSEVKRIIDNFYQPVKVEANIAWKKL